MATLNLSRRNALQMLGATAGFGVAGAMGVVSPSRLQAAPAAAGVSRDLELAYMSAGKLLKLFR